MPLRFAAFLYFFVLLMQTAFSFRPRLLLWTTACGIGAWTLGFLAIVHAPGIVTDAAGRGQPRAPGPSTSPRTTSRTSSSRTRSSCSSWSSVGPRPARPAVPRARGRADRGRARARQPRALLLAQGGRRARRARRAAGPRAAAAGRRALRRPRRLHHDGRGHDARGGDGAAARLPRPDGGGGLPARRAAWRSSSATRCSRRSACPTWAARDATDTLACARGMLAALEAWNAERAPAGLPPMRMGLGLHYGPVVAGDIGSAAQHGLRHRGRHHQRREPPAGADARPRRQHRRQRGAGRGAIERESADAALLEGLAPRACTRCAGRDASIDVWAE